MDKKEVIRALRGYARANEITASERIKWLENLTPAEASALAHDLQQAWEMRNYSIAETDELRSRHLRSLISVRGAFFLLAKTKELI